MVGYLGAQPADPAAPRWVRTGDIATMDADGFIRIVGRASDMIIRGGENLYPAEIEKHLAEHPAVAEVAVIGVPDETYGEELCAVLRLKPAASLEAEAFRAWCRGQVSRWKVPRYVAFVDEMPTTASGKIRKHDLKAAIDPARLRAAG
jgi:fatty-acyl-CoA synthase